MTSKEIELRSDAFAERLWQEGVPEDQLRPAYDRALKGYRKPFPLVLTDWLSGYDALRAEGNHASPCTHCAARAKNPALPPCQFHPIPGSSPGVTPAMEQFCSSCDHADCYQKRLLVQQGVPPATGDLRGTEIKSK